MKTIGQISDKLKEIENDLDLHLANEWAIDDHKTKVLSMMAKNSMEKQIGLLRWVLNIKG